MGSEEAERRITYHILFGRERKRQIVKNTHFFSKFSFFGPVTKWVRDSTITCAKNSFILPQEII